MTKSAVSLSNSEITGLRPLAQVPLSSTGGLLGELGSGRPLTVSAQLADLRPADTDHRLVATLERISGQPPVMLTRTYFPNEGPAYSLVAEIRWRCPAAVLEECARVIEGAFRAAPEDKIAAELYKLRTLTRGREQRDSAAQEGEAMVWLEMLRCWPGDIVIDTLRSWPSRPDGKWWPTWHDIQEELRRRQDKRMALANFVRRALQVREGAPALEHHAPTDEQRAAAVKQHWEDRREQFRADPDAQSRKQEAPDQIMERLHREAGKSVVIGESLRSKLNEMMGGE